MLLGKAKTPVTEADAVWDRIEHKRERRQGADRRRANASGRDERKAKEKLAVVG